MADMHLKRLEDSGGHARAVAIKCLGAVALLAVLPVTALAQEARPDRVRYDTDRATLYFEAGPLSAAEMDRFSRLADQGIVDIEKYLNGGAPPQPGDASKIVYSVSSRIRMSRAFRRRVMLPMERVKADTAPYLHETTHVLLPMRGDCLWLGEGFASYVQSYVSENLGGYDGYVFSWGGNRNVDRLAKRYLATERGRAVLPYVAGGGAPPEIDSERREVAAPFYVLSHSFSKFLVEKASLPTVKALHDATDVAAQLERATGRTASQWRSDWLSALGNASDGGEFAGMPAELRLLDRLAPRP